MKRTKIFPVRWIDEQHDSDWDKVPNYRDCQPFNPHRQDNQDNMLKAISRIKVRIRVGDTVLIGSYGNETGKVTEIKGNLVKVDAGSYSEWIPANVVEKYKWG